MVSLIILILLSILCDDVNTIYINDVLSSAFVRSSDILVFVELDSLSFHRKYDTNKSDTHLPILK